MEKLFLHPGEQRTGAAQAVAVAQDRQQRAQISLTESDQQVCQNSAFLWQRILQVVLREPDQFR